MGIIRFIIGASACLLIGGARAEAEGVKVTLIANKVTIQNDGAQRLIAATTAKPGDVILYQAVYANAGKTKAKNLYATMPIPAGMSFISGSAAPEKAFASLDGKVFDPIPLKRMVKKSNGATEEENVPFEEYRFLRWRFSELPAGDSREVTAKMLVNN